MNANIGNFVRFFRILLAFVNALFFVETAEVNRINQSPFVALRTDKLGVARPNSCAELVRVLVRERFTSEGVTV